MAFFPVEYGSEGEYLDENDAGVDTVLLSLVQSYDWQGTLARIRSFPEECRIAGVEARMPLHVACDHDAPAIVVQEILQTYPEASLMVGTSEMNPLHITCSSKNASVDVVRCLLKGGLASQSSMRDVDGDTPLHAACRCGAPIEVLDTLLMTNPAAVNEADYESLTPIFRLWIRVLVILGNDVIESVQGPDDLKGELGEIWKKTELLLRCAYFGSPEENPSFRAVHAASLLDCPRSVVKIATILYPEQLEEKDGLGRTPFIIAAQAPVFKVRDLSDAGYILEDQIHGNNQEDNTTSVNREEDQVSSQPSVIDILAQASVSTKAACIPDNDGRIPLHHAIDCGKTWSRGIKTILGACPESLSLPDVRTGLLPFLQAATVKEVDTGTIYELLRKDPSLLGDFY